jgi:hypothetical protein
MRPNRLNYTAIAALLTAAATATVLLPTGPWLGVPVALAYLGGLGWLFGEAWLSGEPRLARFGFGMLAVTAALMAQGAAIYRLFDLGPAWTALLTVLVGAEVAATAAWRNRRGSFERVGELLGQRLSSLRPAARPAPLLLRLSALALALLAAALLIGYFLRLDAWATDLAIRSPWDLLPDRFLAIVAVAVAALVVAALSGLGGHALLLPLAALAVMFTALAARLYAAGFGFDPFIHQATESAILRDGVITPKPFYYLGQYALVTWLARATDLGIRVLDPALVPAAFTAAVMTAAATLRRTLPPLSSSGHHLSSSGLSRESITASLAVFLLPLAGFIMTTPQGLADALFLITAFLAFAALVGKTPMWLAWPTALAAAAVHPLTGLPALLLVCAVAVARLEDVTLRRRLALALGVAGAAALPALFAISNVLAGRGLGLTAAPLHDLTALWSSLVATLPPLRLYDALDLAYAWRAVRVPFVLALALAGALACHRSKKNVWPLLLIAGVAVVDYVALKSFFSFDFLIASERANYADRLWPIALFALAPLAATGLGLFAARLRRAGLLPTIVLVAVLTAAVVSNLYLTYPRRDRHESSRGWSTAAADVEAVRLIAADAGAVPYVVLANQSTSAAALRELGFAGHYFRPADRALGTEIYRYPIPTGDPLYQRFLAMNEARGDRAEAEATMRTVGVSRLYYVVSFYWNNAGAIVPAATRASDLRWNLKNQVFVFRYDLPQD